MKRFLRIISLITAIAVLLTMGAWAEDRSYLERKPDYSAGLSSEFRETSCSIYSQGNTLSATITLPSTDTLIADDQIPMVVLAHGMGSNQEYLSDLAWILADNGIASIRFDMAGSGNSTGEQADMTLSSQVANVLSVLDYVRALPYVDSDSIYLGGKSLGGVVAMLAAAQQPEDIAGLVLWYPGLGIADGVNNGRLLEASFDPDHIPETVTASGYIYGRSFILECQQFDRETLFTEITCPVLIIHGNNDHVVPVYYSLEANDKLTDCTLSIIPGGGHGFYGRNELLALALTTEWFDAQLNTEA